MQFLKQVAEVSFEFHLVTAQIKRGKGTREKMELVIDSQMLSSASDAAPESCILNDNTQTIRPRFSADEPRRPATMVTVTDNPKPYG
jgi:hypothetical protein